MRTHEPKSTQCTGCGAEVLYYGAFQPYYCDECDAEYQAEADAWPREADDMAENFMGWRIWG